MNAAMLHPQKKLYPQIFCVKTIYNGCGESTAFSDWKAALKRKIFILSFFVGFVFAACRDLSGGSPSLVHKPLATASSKDFRPLAINEVAILPLSVRSDETRKASLESSLTDYLVRAFELESTLTVLNSRVPLEKEASVREIINSKLPEKTRATELAKQLGAQGALYGVVNRVGELRDAGNASAGSGIAFMLWLMDAETQKVVWTASYEQNDQPLSENLFRMGSTSLRYEDPQAKLLSGFREAARALEKLRASSGQIRSK